MRERPHAIGDVRLLARSEVAPPDDDMPRWRREVDRREIPILEATVADEDGRDGGNVDGAVVRKPVAVPSIRTRLERQAFNQDVEGSLRGLRELLRLIQRVIAELDGRVHSESECRSLAADAQPGKLVSSDAR